MDLRQLEVFVQVAEQGSFSAAAERLHLSQPTVSAHISALEQELGARLIRRTTRLFALTEQGERLYAHAVSILDLHRKAVLDLLGEERRQLHIGASSVPGRCLLPAALEAFHRLFPETQYEVLLAESLDIIQKVSDGNLDLGLVGTKTKSPCSFFPIARDELVVAAPNTARYRRMHRSGAGLAELLKEPFLLRTDHSGTQRAAGQYLAELGFSMEDLNVVARFSDAEILRLCLARGLGISILSRKIVEDLIRREEVLAFSLDPGAFTRDLYVVCREKSYLPKTAKAFIDLLKSGGYE